MAVYGKMAIFGCAQIAGGSTVLPAVARRLIIFDSRLEYFFVLAFDLGLFLREVEAFDSSSTLLADAANDIGNRISLVPEMPVGYVRHAELREALAASLST